MASTQNSVRQFVETLLTEAKSKKLSVDKLSAHFHSEEVQSQLTKAIKDVQPRVRLPRTRPLQDPNRPKKANSAYLCFCSHQRDLLKAQHAGDKHQPSATEIVKMLATAWNNADENTRKPFVAAAALDAQRYKREMESYVPPAGEAPAKTVAAPRRKSGYILFSTHRRAELKQSGEKHDGTVLAAITAEWAAMAENGGQDEWKARAAAGIGSVATEPVAPAPEPVKKARAPRATKAVEPVVVAVAEKPKRVRKVKAVEVVEAE